MLKMRQKSFSESAAPDSAQAQNAPIVLSDSIGGVPSQFPSRSTLAAFLLGAFSAAKTIHCHFDYNVFRSTTADNVATLCVWHERIMDALQSMPPCCIINV